MTNKIAQEIREAYEKEIKGICNECNEIIERAREDFIAKKNQARHNRHEAISEIKRKYES